MDNQNPNFQQPIQPSISSEPIQPTVPVQPIQSVQSPQSVFQVSQPVVQTPPPNIPPITEPFYKKKIFIIIAAVVVFLILSAIVVIAFTKNRSGSKLTDSVDTSVPTLIPYSAEPEKVCSSPLAPSGTTDFEKCYYRSTKASITEAQAVQNRVAKTFGVIAVPDNLKFQEEVYKGIHIKWTNSQPISSTTMSWLKEAIDVLPPYFYQDHPVTAIISATSEELGNTGFTPESLGAGAYASGLNIFLVKDFAQGSSTQYVVDKPTIIFLLFHEWVHVVQNYETLQTFTEDYLSIPGNVVVAMPNCPFNKSYAKAAGWVFQDDQYANSTYAILGTDADSQKQSDYGKTKYIEDMAEAGASFMLCKDTLISEGRIKWWEQTTGTSRNSYCPSKI